MERINLQDSIDSLNLTSNIKKGLKMKGINTIQDLISSSYETIINLVQTNGINLLQRKLNELGLRLFMSDNAIKLYQSYPETSLYKGFEEIEYQFLSKETQRKLEKANIWSFIDLIVLSKEELNQRLHNDNSVIEEIKIVLALLDLKLEMSREEITRYIKDIELNKKKNPITKINKSILELSKKIKRMQNEMQTAKAILKVTPDKALQQLLNGKEQDNEKIEKAASALQVIKDKLTEITRLEKELEKATIKLQELLEEVVRRKKEELKKGKKV